VLSQRGDLSFAPTVWTNAGRSLSRKIWLVSCIICSVSFYLFAVCLSLSDWVSDCLQVLLARQAVRARRRITRKSVKQRLMDSRKLLKKLHLLAAEVRHLSQCMLPQRLHVQFDWRMTSFLSFHTVFSPRVLFQMLFSGCIVEASDWRTSGSLPTPSCSHWWRTRRGGTVAASPLSTWRLHFYICNHLWHFIIMNNALSCLGALCHMRAGGRIQMQTKPGRQEK